MLNSLNGSVANTSDKRIKKYLGKLAFHALLCYGS